MMDAPPDFPAFLVGTPCAIVGHETAGGVYDDKGNCIVPFRFTRPDGVVLQSAIVSNCVELSKEPDISKHCVSASGAK